MKKKYLFILGFVASIVLTIIGCYKQTPILVTIGTLANIVLGALVSILLSILDTHGHGLRLWWQHFKFWDKEISLSFSYLFKVPIEGRYLLIKGNRLKTQYQPVGGVYKYYDEAKPALEKFKFRPDIRMRNTDDTDDLRVCIKGRYILKFMDWFVSMKDREYDPYREFREELIDSSLLPSEKFETLKYRKISTHNRGVTYSKFFGSNEFIYADIFEITLTKEQQDLIKTAVSTHPDKLCLATAEELYSECFDGIEKNLGNNCSWLLGV